MEYDQYKRYSNRKREEENFYHGILLGLLGYKSSWLIKSNAESGIGYELDILIEAPENRTGIVIELKYAKMEIWMQRASRLLKTD